MNHNSGDASAEGATPEPTNQTPALDASQKATDNLRLTKIEKSLTKTKKEDFHTPVPLGPRRPGRPARTGKAPVTWSVRGVSPETRAVLEQGAAQAGKPMGQFLNEDVCNFVMQRLKGDAAPASPVVVEEIQYLRQLVENLTKLVATNNAEDDARTTPES